MALIEQIKTWDTELFLWFNAQHHPFMDEVMWQLSNKWFLIPVYAALLALVFRKTDWKTTLAVVISIVVVVIISDQLANLSKHSFQRYRPCNNLDIRDQVHIVNDYCRSSFSFFSAHSSTSFGIMMFFGLLFKRMCKKKWIMPVALCWAALIAYSRVYLGVHYPADIAVGAILGSLIGWGSYRIFRMVAEKKSIKPFAA